MSSMSKCLAVCKNGNPCPWNGKLYLSGYCKTHYRIHNESLNTSPPLPPLPPLPTYTFSYKELLDMIFPIEITIKILSLAGHNIDFNMDLEDRIRYKIKPRKLNIDISFKLKIYVIYLNTEIRRMHYLDMQIYYLQQEIDEVKTRQSVELLEN
jgi:hypothetical protein